mgnify:CR=1 FL=1
MSENLPAPYEPERPTTPGPQGPGMVLPRGADAVEMRKAAATARAEAARKMSEIKRQQAEATEELERMRRDLEAEFARKRAELEAQVAPLKAELEKIEEVSWTVDLYLGRNEDLVLVRDGSPAPADTPISIRQKVLVMAEESLVLMDNGKEGMDYRDINTFVSWLTEAPQNLDRILPEPKGVVVLIPTRVASKTGNPWEDGFKDAQNKASYWLIRNGERLYLLTVDPELRVTQRVLPRRAEFVEVFDQRLFGFGGSKSEPVRPGSEEWLKMEKVADARRRHYMRIMLVLQGIIDRTPAWAPLPPDGVNLLSVDAQDSGKVVLIQDAEESIQLGDGHETFAAFQKRLNGLLRPGLRVIGDWTAEGFRELWERGDRYYRDRHPRLYPPTTGDRPEAGVPHLIEGRKDGGFVIRFKRTEEIWKRNVPIPDRPGWVYREHPVTPTQRASCVVMPGDNWVLPFDLLTVRDLEYFLASREERSRHFLSMVPVLRAALAAKRAEAEAEAPFRVLLRDLLLAEGAEHESVDVLLDDLVTRWKVAKTWSKPLNGEPKHEAKAAREIVAEYRARANQADSGSTEAMVKAGRTVPGAICVGRTRRNEWFAYAPSTPAHDQGVFLDVTPIRKDGTLGETKTWQRVQQRTASVLQVAWSTEEWDGWKFTANPMHYLTDPERQDMLARVLDGVASPICVVEHFDPLKPDSRQVAVYHWLGKAAPADTPAWATDEPFRTTYGFMGKKDRETLVSSNAFRVTKDKAGVHLEKTRGEAGFGHYSPSSPSLPSDLGLIPWWPDDAQQYGSRPRLIWSDADMIESMAEHRRQCIKVLKEGREADERLSAEARRYCGPMLDLIEQRQVAVVHDAFVVDFGLDAEDLFPAHLASLNLRQPIHQYDLTSTVKILLEHGEVVTGRTLAEVSQSAYEKGTPDTWGRLPKALDVGEYGDLIFPEPESEPED